MNEMKHEQKKPHFNVIDLLILLAVIAVLGALVMRFDVFQHFGEKTEQSSAIISFRIEGVRRTSANAMVVGDTYIWDANNAVIGTLQSVSVEPFETVAEMQDGNLMLASDEQKCVLVGTILASGTMTDQGFMLNGTQFLSAGKEIEVHSQHIMVKMLLTGISNRE